MVSLLVYNMYNIMCVRACLCACVHACVRGGRHVDEYVSGHAITWHNQLGFTSVSVTPYMAFAISSLFLLTILLRLLNVDKSSSIL